MLQVEPLPLVPPTEMIGKETFKFKRSRTILIRSSVRSIVEGCVDSIYPSQSVRFIGRLCENLEGVKLIFR
jgi:hypothetical protein